MNGTEEETQRGSPSPPPPSLHSAFRRFGRADDFFAFRRSSATDAHAHTLPLFCRGGGGVVGFGIPMIAPLASRSLISINVISKRVFTIISSRMESGV